MQKKIALKASIAIASILALGAAQAQTAVTSGKIDFTGEVITSTCEIDVANSFKKLDLQKMSATQLKDAGSTGGRKAFHVKITKCGTGGSPAQVGLDFENGAFVNPVTGRLTAGSGSAKGVEIALLNDKYEHIKIGAQQADQKSQFVDINKTTGEAVLHYSAEYVGTGETVTPGTLITSVTYSLTYP
ncbi:Fimbria A protein precursor [Delftia tsuruhatensis]|uniref:fimbrial protein n=1 Tax=Delftia tsuruhatensis TaxID=180282 RepID=UPI001E701AA4|nr:fimbrial protein [Delftia tsuruhatensis]CAB5715497.1 Fimbria A protein precursor [Delftia tsuruhatensis]CAC9676738.1 Fimbria A protein precursor [Delftia tsuruhatensis]